MPLINARTAAYSIVYENRLIAIKGAALAASGAIKALKFGNGAAGVWS